MHEIHTSGRKSYRACRRRWDWIFRQSYYPLMTAKPLEFGVAFHEAMEVYYNPETWYDDRDIVGQESILKFIERNDKQRKLFLENKDQQYLDADVQEDYDERIELGRGMLNHYFKIAPELDKNFKPIRVEVAFHVPIKDPNGVQLRCACEEHAPTEEDPDRNLVFYSGRLDCLGEDQYGDYWILDWKTARSIMKNDDFLYLDDQVGSYVWALRKMLNMPVRGFIYAEIRKAFPEPPKENKARRLGRLFSVSQSASVDLETYVKTVSTEDTAAYEEGLYDDYIEWLKSEGPVYTYRKQIHKTDAELDEIGHNIYLEAVEMVNPDILIYPSPGRFGCNFCAFQQPCREKNSQGDYMYALDTLFEKRAHYYVREEASTDSKGGE